MRRSIASQLRRARRFGVWPTLKSLFSQYQSQIPWTPTPPSKKHFKIDDEELQSDDYDKYLYNRRQRGPVFTMTTMILLTLLVILLIAFTITHMIYKPPQFIINYLSRKYPDVLFQVNLPSSVRVVALTIDDAPSPETEKILDLLKEYKAKATFFVIGSQIRPHQSVLKRIIKEGHEIGNHAWEDEPSYKLPFSELERQIKEVESKVLANANGLKYFRPGSGFFNKDLVRKVKGMGYKIVLGSIYPHDPQIHNAKMNAKHVVSMARPGGIIIMHDRRSYSARQLELVLKGLVTKGIDTYKIEPLGGLLRIAETTDMFQSRRESLKKTVKQGH